MIITLGFYRRKAGLSTEEFRHIWSEIYGPLYARHPEVTRHLLRYVQHHLSPNRDWPTVMVPYDGFSEAWFDSVKAREAMHAEPIYRENIASLMGSFLDLENSKFAAYDSPVYQIGAPPLLTDL